MLGGFLRRRLGQEQHSKQKALGPHPDGACSLGTHDRRTSGHSLSYFSIKSEQKKEAVDVGRRIPKPLQKPRIYPQPPSPVPGPLAEATRPQDG